MNKGELISAITFDCKSKNAATLAEIPRFIRLAEGLMARRLRSSEQDSTITLTDADRGGDATADTYTAPAGILQVRRVAIAGYGDFVQRGPNAIRLRMAGSSPAYFCDLGGRLQIRGTPAAGAEVVLDYFGRLAALDANTDTNVILTNHEILYTAGALYYLFKSQQELELANEQRGHFDDEVQALNEEAGRKFGGAGAAPAYDFGAGGSY